MTGHHVHATAVPASRQLPLRLRGKRRHQGLEHPCPTVRSGQAEPKHAGFDTGIIVGDDRVDGLLTAVESRDRRGRDGLREEFVPTMFRCHSSGPGVRDPSRLRTGWPSPKRMR